MDLAIGERDHATFNMPQWFVNEQVEEERSFEEVVTKLKLAGNDTRAILFLDSELGKGGWVQKMNLQALYKISYGLYIVSSAKNGKLSAQIANTVFQLTSEPPKIGACLNKKNKTYEFVKDSKPLL